MIDVERIVPNGVVCLYNVGAYHRLSTTVPPGFCIAIANKRKVMLPRLFLLNFTIGRKIIWSLASYWQKSQDIKYVLRIWSGAFAMPLNIVIS